jgi:hypothetical protein
LLLWGLVHRWRRPRAAELDKEVDLFQELLTYLPADVRVDLGGRMFLTMFASPISSAGMEPRVPYDGFVVRHFIQEQAGHFLGTSSTVPPGLLDRTLTEV